MALSSDLFVVVTLISDPGRLESAGVPQETSGDDCHRERERAHEDEEAPGGMRYG